jgi:CMP-N-acetylneuraminic acid synthetase
MENKKILAIIPARGGSKGLPRKNLINLCGKPLIAWTIEASLGSKLITKTIVSSDDDEILRISKQYGADVVRRPDILSSDTATSESVVSHVISWLSLNGEDFDTLILLQPTSPLRTSSDIDKALISISNTGVTSLISVLEIDNKLLKSFKENKEGFLEPITSDKYHCMRRQDLPDIFMSNGSIYIVKIDEFKSHGSFITDNMSYVKMNKIKSIDIDTKEDIDSVESFLKLHNDL